MHAYRWLHISTKKSTFSLHKTLISVFISHKIQSIPLLACHQTNKQYCLPNGFVVQHTRLLKWHLIRGIEQPFYMRLIGFFESTFSSLSFCLANGFTAKAMHIHFTGSLKIVRKWAKGRAGLVCRLTLNNKHMSLCSGGQRERLCLQNTFGDPLKTQF